MSIVKEEEQKPGSGVNTYRLFPATEVEIVAGFQVPVTPFFDVEGKAGAAINWHKGQI